MKLDKNYKVRVTPEQSRKIHSLILLDGGEVSYGLKPQLQDEFLVIENEHGSVVIYYTDQDIFLSAEQQEIQADDLITLLTDLPKSAESLHDNAGNMQDKELNTQAPQVSYPDNEEATLINPSAEVVNPSAEVVNPGAMVDNPSAIDTNTDHDAIINEGVKQIGILEEAKDAPHEKLIMPKKTRNKPFTPNPIMGYQVQKGKAKIFLDRRATSKTLTLSLEDLKELVNAVEKSERVA